MRVAVAVEGEVTTRAAQSLATHPDVEVVLLAPATSSQFEVVDDPTGCAAVVGREKAARAAADHGVPAVVTSELAGLEGVAWASLPGLALALAAQLEAEALVAVAEPGDPSGSDTVVFPSPIDGRTVESQPIGHRRVVIGRGEGGLGAALALGKDRHRVIVDDHRFMEAVALAAGIAVLDGGTVPVWERAGPYLRAATEMGLVIGERAPV